MSYDPSFVVSARTLALVEEIAILRTRVLAATVQVPWIPRLQQDARARNAHSSTAIEGNPLTQEQVRELAAGRDVPAVADRARREVLNYFAALRHIETHGGKRRLTHRDVSRLHLIAARGVMDQGEAGEYRRVQVWVGPHKPPPPGRVEELMSDLLDWWNGPARDWPPVVSSAVVHHRFEEIHPFGDGNGRVGRLLALWELYRRGFDTHHIFSVDEYFWEDRARYYQALREVEQRSGDLTGWLEYCAEGLRQTLERVWTRIQRLVAGSSTAGVILRPRQEQLLTMLRDRQSMTPREIREALGVSKQGALDLLNPLLEAGLVKRTGTRKSGRYMLQ
ncbi:MAG: Fic family protein [candidate division WOR-3 bacterium]|nr:MAG: Fic family protein [candidate division WOR-3 bacterium]